MEHIHDVLKIAVEQAKWQGRGKVDDYCIMNSVRHNAKRYAKLEHLMKMDQEIKVR